MRAVSLLSAPGVRQVSSVVDPLLPVPPPESAQWVWAYRHCVGLVRDGKVAEGVFASGPGLG